MTSMTPTARPPDAGDLAAETTTDVASDGLDPAALSVALREMRDAGLTTIENALPCR